MKPKSIRIATLATMVIPLFISSCASFSAHPDPSPKELAAAKAYPLDTCLVIDRPLSETKRTYTKIYNGQQVKFCCTACIKAFEANPEPFMAKVKK